MPISRVSVQAGVERRAPQQSKLFPEYEGIRADLFHPAHLCNDWKQSSPC